MRCQTALPSEVGPAVRIRVPPAESQCKPNHSDNFEAAARRPRSAGAPAENAVPWPASSEAIFAPSIRPRRETRYSGRAYSSLISPSRFSLPRFHYRVGLHIVLFEVCSAFTHVAACTLAQSPYFVTAIRGLQTFRHLHACPGCFRLERSPGGPCTHLSGALVSSGNFRHRGLHFCGSCDGVGVINGSFAIAANSGKCAGRPRFCHCGKDRINLSPVRSSGP